MQPWRTTQEGWPSGEAGEQLRLDDLHPVYMQRDSATGGGTGAVWPSRRWIRPS